MRTRNALELLAAAGRPLLAEADSLVDAGEEELILTRILATDRQAGDLRRRRRAMLVLAVGVIVAAAVAAVSSGAFTNSSPSTGPQRAALTGPRLKLAGFHFKTPAGYKTSTDSCVAGTSRSGQGTAMDGFAVAASAEGGCIEAAVMIAMPGASWSPAQEGAASVSVGAYEGYFESEDSSGLSTLYVQLPDLGEIRQYLELHSEGLTQLQLIAIAQSGLPQNPADSRTMGPTG